MKRQKSLSIVYEQKKIREGFSFVVGCDEVGRGCLAGPVVAGAVILDLKFKIKDLKYIQDSKVLSPSQRESLSVLIKKYATAWGVGVVSEKVIDKINIHNASLLAMKKAVHSALKKVSNETMQGFVVLDGKFTISKFDMKQEAVVKGDAKILSVAAASIVAKVYRDKRMQKLHGKNPEYNFIQHKGYATSEHRKHIKKLGLLSVHRKSFCKRYVKHG